MSAKASEIIERWSVGVGQTADGQEITPVVWRVRDETWQAEVTARLAADEVRDKTVQAVVDGMAKALDAALSGGASGTPLDTAAIIASQNAIRDEARAEFGRLHAENADLRSQLDAAHAREAAAARAAADAFTPQA